MLFALATLAAIAFAYFEPVQVLPRLRVGPGYALTDGSGRTYTSESGRGIVTVYTFAPLDCEADQLQCDAVNRTMADIAERLGSSPALGEVSVRLVTVALGASHAGRAGRRAIVVGSRRGNLAMDRGHGVRRSSSGGRRFPPLLRRR